MKKRMMMLLTTVALVVGLTACGDSTATTNGSDDYVAPSLVVEGTAEPTTEPTPEVTPEPTAEPAPEYTEVTIRDIQYLMKNVNGTDMGLPLIDGELPDTSLTMAEMYFHVPEGTSVTYEDIIENAEILYGISADELPGKSGWVGYASMLARDKAVDMSGESGTDYATSADYTGDFVSNMTREEWETMFVLVRSLNKMDGEPEWWSNHAELKEEFIQSKKDALVDLFNNYTYTDAYQLVKDSFRWDPDSTEHQKFWTMDNTLDGLIINYRSVFEAAFEAYKAGPTGWVDYYAEYKQQ